MLKIGTIIKKDLGAGVYLLQTKEALYELVSKLPLSAFVNKMVSLDLEEVTGTVLTTGMTGNPVMKVESITLSKNTEE